MPKIDYVWWVGKKVRAYSSGSKPQVFVPDSYKDGYFYVTHPGNIVPQRFKDKCCRLLVPKKTEARYVLVNERDEFFYNSKAGGRWGTKLSEALLYHTNDQALLKVRLLKARHGINSVVKVVTLRLL